MSTHNIGFYEDLIKIIFELSSNTHLISSADHHQSFSFCKAIRTAKCCLLNILNLNN